MSENKYQTDSSEIYLKIRLKGLYGEIEAEISRAVFNYQMKGKDKYVQSVEVLSELYEKMANCEHVGNTK